MKVLNRILLTTMLVLPASLPSFAQRAQEEDPIAAAKKVQTPQSILRMAKDIQKQILTLPDYGLFDSLSFSIKDYAVTLKGYASRPILKDSAERVTNKVEGVQQVTNQIEVLPLSNNDDRIRTRVYAAIYYHQMLSRYNPNRGTPAWVSPARIAAGITNDPPPGNHPIHIIVKNGEVTLEGVVDNAADKQVAEMQANTVGGVFKVTNNLVIPENYKPKGKK